MAATNSAMRSKLISSNPSLSKISPSAFNSLIGVIRQYAKEQAESSSQSIDDIIAEIFKAILEILEYIDIFIAFAELVLKIEEIKDPHAKDALQAVLQYIIKLGRVILNLDEQHPSIITTIVEKALQPKEKLKFEEPGDGIVKIIPKPDLGLIALFIDWVVDHIIKLLNIKPKSKFLEGNYAPVEDETPPTADLIIKGQLPNQLNGMMIRNGPNPQFPPVANYAWMDGDGMLHSVYFKEGEATYASRYVKTSRFKQDQDFGRGEFIQYGDLQGAFGIFMACVYLLKQTIGILDVSLGWFNANEALVFHGGFLMATQDFDRPYAINVLENGDLETLGINNYHNKLTTHFNARPKIDPYSGEMFFLGISYVSPYVTLNIATPDGYLNDPIPITLSGPTYIHDFGITENFVIFMDLSFCFNPEVMVKNDEWVYTFDKKKNARFGILPRNENSDINMKWFEFKQPFFILHNANSWEEDEDTIVLISCLMEEPLIGDNNGKPWIFYSPGHVYNGRHTTEDVILQLPKLYKISFNMRTGEYSKTALSKTHCDHPKINEQYTGRSSRYIYTSEVNEEGQLIGIVKFDMEWETELKLNLGEGKYASEVAYVSRESGIIFGEDDGYLTTFVHDELNSKSFAYVISAETMKILATIDLKAIRVPYGFHAAFITEEELRAQKKLKLGN